VGDEELVDEIALAAHHLDAVVAGLASEPGATHEGADLALDATRAQLPRREGRDRALDARGRHAQRRVAVTPGVQDLQRDLAALGMHGLRDGLMAARGARGRQRTGKGLGPALDIGREAAGHDQPHLAAGPLGEVGRHALEMLAAVLQARVHAAHQHAVLQRREAKVQRREQMGIIHPRDANQPYGSAYGEVSPERRRSRRNSSSPPVSGWTTGCRRLEF